MDKQMRANGVRGFLTYMIIYYINYEYWDIDWIYDYSPIIGFIAICIIIYSYFKPEPTPTNNLPQYVTCPNCNSQMSSDLNYCTKCGNKL